MFDLQMRKTAAETIPDRGQTWKRETIMSQADHPEWRLNAQWYRFLRESHEMTGGYAPVIDSYVQAREPIAQLQSYLVPHEREDPSQFQWRVRTARPPQFVADGIAVTSGVLTYQQPRRSNHPPKVEKWLRWVNAAGQDWRGFVASEVVQLLERYGWMLVMVAPPPVGGANEAERKKALEEADLPELVATTITPEALRGWGLDDLGRFTWIRYVEARYADGGPEVGTIRIRRHWWITRFGWWYVDDHFTEASVKADNADREDPQRIDESAIHHGDQAQQANASHSAPQLKRELVVGGSGHWRTDKKPLSRVPVAVWELSGRISPSFACAMAQVDYYRTESELRNLEAQTAFSQLWIPALSDNTDPRSKIRGASVIGTFPYDARHVPMILSPDSGPFAHFMQRLQDLRNEAYGAWGLRQDLSGGSTGLALSLIQERSTNLYRQHAEALTAGDVATMEIAAEFFEEEIEDGFTAEYPTDFSSLTSTAIVDMAEKLINMDVGEFFETEVKVEACRAGLPHLTDDQLEEGRKAIEERIKEREEQAQEMHDLEIAAQSGGDDEGRPPALDPKRARGEKGQERLAGKEG